MVKEKLEYLYVYINKIFALQNLGTYSSRNQRKKKRKPFSKIIGLHSFSVIKKVTCGVQRNDEYHLCNYHE